MAELPAPIAVPWPVPGHQHQISTRSIVATVRYDPFQDIDTYWEGPIRWVRANAVYNSKKRFYRNHTFADFMAAADSEPNRLISMHDSQGTLWIRAL